MIKQQQINCIYAKRMLVVMPKEDRVFIEMQEKQRICGYGDALAYQNRFEEILSVILAN